MPCIIRRFQREENKQSISSNLEPVWTKWNKKKLISQWFAFKLRMFFKDNTSHGKIESGIVIEKVSPDKKVK